MCSVWITIYVSNYDLAKSYNWLAVYLRGRDCLLVSFSAEITNEVALLHYFLNNAIVIFIALFHHGNATECDLLQEKFGARRLFCH